MTAGRPPANLQAAEQGRIHAIDGMRLVAVLSVFVAHTQDMFKFFYSGPRVEPPILVLDHPLVAPRAAGFDPATLLPYLAFIAPMGMALFFGLSGAGAWLALRTRSEWKYLARRVTRLGPPLVVAILVLAPLQRYFEELSNGTYEGSLLTYYPHFFTAIRVNLTPLWIGNYFRHLWFLVDLFVFMVITLPLFALLKRPIGSAWTARFAATLEQPGGLAVLVLPIVAIRVALGGTFPAYENWTDQVCWLVIYIYGYLLIGDSRRIVVLERHGPLAGVVSIVCTLALGRMGNPPVDGWSVVAWQALDALNLCAWLVVATWLGPKVFYRDTSLLRYGNRVLLWFYILHYPILAVGAYYIIPLDLPPAARPPMLGLTAFLLSVMAADLLTRRRTHSAAALRFGS